jgi:hypothetical protein
MNNIVPENPPIPDAGNDQPEASPNNNLSVDPDKLAAERRAKQVELQAREAADRQNEGDPGNEFDRKIAKSNDTNNVGAAGPAGPSGKPAAAAGSVGAMEKIGDFFTGLMEKVQPALDSFMRQWEAFLNSLAKGTESSIQRFPKKWRETLLGMLGTERVVFFRKLRQHNIELAAEKDPPPFAALTDIYENKVKPKNGAPDFESFIDGALPAKGVDRKEITMTEIVKLAGDHADTIVAVPPPPPPPTTTTPTTPPPTTTTPTTPPPTTTTPTTPPPTTS